MINYDIKNNLFSPELLENLAEKQGQSAEDFGLRTGVRVSDEISHAFSTIRHQWSNFKRKIDPLSENQSGFTETRMYWVEHVFSELGYDFQRIKKKIVMDELSFTISHKDDNLAGFPLNMVGFKQGLDENPDSSRGNRQSPHVQLQEYLNHTEHLYGIVTNGYKIRLLRDHHRITGIQYLEWDMQIIMEENDLPSFALLYRMLHTSRIPQKMGDDCLLENYHQDSVEEGHRVRHKLQQAVKKSLEELGNGFLKHPQNIALREQLEENLLSEEEYGYLLRKLVYRLLFLLVAEERKLIFNQEVEPEIKNIYESHYSLSRFRTMAESHFAVNDRYSDIWEQLKTNFLFFEKEGSGDPLGISPLGGDLFEENTLGVLIQSKLSNTSFLKTIDLLSRFKNQHQQLNRINYRRINVEEFGAVYESLLDLHPKVNLKIEHSPFYYPEGKSRKSTGAYYTHDDLVKQLLKTALQPVLKERLKEAEEGETTQQGQNEAKEKALLNLKVCDPACGSGHFLLGAARALATELTHIRINQESQFDDYYRSALRDVIEHCIYGVDINPDAVELCRLVLWMEAHVPGKAISYLNHKIKCGNSAVGWRKGGVDLTIPNGAFKPIYGDDDKIALLFEQKNERESKNYLLDFEEDKIEEHKEQVANEFRSLDRMPTNSLKDLWLKKMTHKELENSPDLVFRRRVYDVWTYSFFQPYVGLNQLTVTQSFLNKVIDKELDETNPFIIRVQDQARQRGFFHWELEFPDVFCGEINQKGFSLVVQNPPWERMMLQEKEFFGVRCKEIAEAPKASIRKELINTLERNEPLYLAYLDAKRSIDGEAKFFSKSNIYPLTGFGIINKYSIFSEFVLDLFSSKGAVGSIVPTGVATDNNNCKLFSHLVRSNYLESLFDFENKKKLFPEVDSRFKFSLLTIRGRLHKLTHDINFSFFLKDVSELNNRRKLFKLTSQEFQRINPNTETSPVFRNRVDASITSKVYSRSPIILNDTPKVNPWNLSCHLMFNMSSDSGLFLDPRKGQITNEGILKVERHQSKCVPLYEAKHFWLFNHRYNSYSQQSFELQKVKKVLEVELKQFDKKVSPKYCVPHSNYVQRLKIKKMSSKYEWFLGYRVITAGTNERTFICSILPKTAYGNSCQLILSKESSVKQSALLSNMSSIVFDFICRQKLGGNNLNLFYFKQLPIIPPEQFTPKDLHFIVPRVLELTYSSWDLKAFADDVWGEADEQLRNLIQTRWENNKRVIYLEESEKPDWVESKVGEFPNSPSRWDTQHRLKIQCELDAYFAWKYQLEEEELKYILDPLLSKLVGETEEERDSFPGETFRVLKEKEIKKYGEYRTCKLVLEAWNKRPWENPYEQVILKEAIGPKVRDYEKAKKAPSVMAYIIKRHGERPRYEKKLGRTKMEKLLHGIEYVADINLGRIPVMDEFGPADFELITQVERNASELDYFETTKEQRDKDSYRFRYSKSENFSTALEEFDTHFSKEKEKIDRFINLFLDFGSTETELRITVFAAWNNLLLDQTPIENDDQIIKASREDWHESKTKHKPQEFHEAILWLRGNNLVPEGKGKRVEKL